jgi:hypothetical protein
MKSLYAFMRKCYRSTRARSNIWNTFFKPIALPVEVTLNRNYPT